jgi:biopolymer transport protein ExbB
MRFFTFLLLTSFLFGKSDLELAYEKEFAFLELQKRELQKRLREVKKSNGSKLWVANRDIEKLQSKFVTKQGESESISNRITSIEMETESLSLNTDTLENTLLQSETTLSRYHKFSHDDREDISTQLEKAFVLGNKTILELASIRKEQGEFFLADGKGVEGTILKIGNIASYGISEEAKGMLAPAGGERLKVWSVPADEVVTKLEAGEKPETLDIFLYESLTKEISERKEKTALEVINSGGIIGWVIVVLGAFAVLLVLIRYIYLQSASGDINRLYKKVQGHVSNGEIEKALEISHSKKTSIANVMNATLRNIDRDRQHLDDIISEAILHESGRLDKFNTLIMIIAAVAPLLGLLGTVTGMITTFDLITEFGTGDPKMLSGGISEALVTTELGLIVAIPALVFGNMLSGWAEKIKDDMEHSALKVSNIYSIYKEK